MAPHGVQDLPGTGPSHKVRMPPLVRHPTCRYPNARSPCHHSRPAGSKSLVNPNDPLCHIGARGDSRGNSNARVTPDGPLCHIGARRASRVTPDDPLCHIRARGDSRAALHNPLCHIISRRDSRVAFHGLLCHLGARSGSQVTPNAPLCHLEAPRGGSWVTPNSHERAHLSGFANGAWNGVDWRCVHFAVGQGGRGQF
jgi:hypothetical protein